jgi:hypothetical protein
VAGVETGIFGTIAVDLAAAFGAYVFCLLGASAGGSFGAGGWAAGLLAGSAAVFSATLVIVGPFIFLRASFCTSSS